MDDASQFDGLTAQCAAHDAAAETVQSLTVEAKAENMDAVNEFVDSFLEEHGCPMKTQMQIDLCVEEIFVNIANYAYGSGTGSAEVQISETNGEATLTFIDSGTAYDPLAKDDPDITLSAAERKIGGLGIFLVKKTMDHVSYRRDNGKNVFTMKKRW